MTFIDHYEVCPLCQSFSGCKIGEQLAKEEDLRQKHKKYNEEEYTYQVPWINSVKK